MKVWQLRIISRVFVVLFAANIKSENFAWFDTSLSHSERIEALIDAMTVEEKITQLMNSSPAIPRLGIKEYDWWNECLHGVARNGRATVFPQPIGLAATFDDALALRVATAISDEARAKFNIAQAMNNYSKYSGLSFWTPNVNIFRDPRWGRGMETYGEDPFLTSKMGLSFVKGLQGDDSAYLKSAACAKHFAVHSGPEELRHEFDVIPTKKDLYETYLPAFKTLVIDGKVESVMGAYNRVYGDPACGSELLLKDILRDEWGFEGHVVSDCGAIADFWRDHKVTPDAASSAALAIKTGTDLNCGNTYEALGEALEKGLVTAEDLNVALRRMLRSRMKLGLLDRHGSTPWDDLGEEVVESKEHVALAREVAQKSIVLLKNKNHTLPLKKDIRNLYITGPFASSTEILLGNYYGLSSNTVTILDGIVNKVSAGTTINYKYGVLPFRENVNPIDWTTGTAKVSDATIAVMGISNLLEGEEGESIASSSKGDRLDLNLPKSQLDFLKKLRKDNDKPIIVVMTGGSPITMPEVDALADAIVWVWYPGQEGGNAVADVLFGDVNPSGRLPITFPASEDQLPPYEDYSMKGRTYKYMTEKPLYPFGYGLSYTRFAYDRVLLSSEKVKKGNSVELTLNVENTGEVDGNEIVQLYISCKDAAFDVPQSTLIGFKNVFLKKGDSKEISFTISADQMKMFNADGKAVFVKGNYSLFVGGVSPGERGKELVENDGNEASFELK